MSKRFWRVTVNGDAYYTPLVSVTPTATDAEEYARRCFAEENPGTEIVSVVVR